METLYIAIAAGGGLALGRALKFPFWALTGPFLAVGVLQVVSAPVLTLPSPSSIVGQVLVGTAAGSRAGRSLLRDFRAILVPGLVAVLSILVVSVLLGWTMGNIASVDGVTAMLGMAPGGLSEMVGAAEGLGADESLVALMHLVRLLVVLAVLSMIIGRLRPGAEPGPGE